MLFIGVLGSHVLTTDWLETSFLALLPATEQQPEIAKAIQQHNEVRDRRVIWLVGAENAGTAIAYARQIKVKSQQSGLFKSVTLEVPQREMMGRYQALFPYRSQLLDKQTRSSLQADPKHVLQQNLETLYSPLGQMAAINLEQDPLLLFNRYINAQNPLSLSLEQGIPILQGEGKHWALLLAELKDSHLQLDKLEALQTLVKDMQRQAQASGCLALVTGMPVFTAAGAESASQEISTVGAGASTGIILLLLLTFHSVRPLLLSFLAISSGILGALVVSILVFGKVHIITLVFGASLIGVADDYALHFVCDSFVGKGWQPRHALVHLLPGLVIGLLTNLLSYSGLMLSPFPGLQEVAVFSAAGLLLAWLAVVLLFPLLLTGFHSGRKPTILKFADYWQQHWPMWVTKNRRWLMPVVAAFIVSGLWQLTPRDDVRLLQSAPVALTKQADAIKQLLPISQDNQFFLVAGKSLTEWHQNEQALLERLHLLKQQGKLKLFQGLSASWPDEGTQQSNYQLLDSKLYESGQVKQYMADLGFNDKAIANEIKQFQAVKGRTISLVDWLNTADEAKRNLWLSCDSGQCRSMVALTGISDLSALSALQMQGVSWVDQVEELSSLFARYRVQASFLLVAAYVAVFLGLGFKFGWRNAVTITAIPVLSALVALAMMGWCNQLFSVFNLFALLLVLGIGVDDAIFFHTAGHSGKVSINDPTLDESLSDKRATTSLAVTLSALTTLLAFGLLAVSSTEIVHAFGFTVTFGIITALLCSPLVGYKHKTDQQRKAV